MYDLELRVNRQVLKTTKQSLIVTGSIKYLTVRAYFSQDWENAAKTIFFTHDDITISKVLNLNNEITQNDDLQLNESGLWNVCIIGSKTNGQVITTNPIVINVISKLDIDNGIVPTPQDQTLYQKALSIANEAILKATEVQRKADNHEFDGFSPRVNIQKNPFGQYVLTIEDQEGIKTAVIKDGKDGVIGQDGFSPTVSVDNIDNGSVVTITDVNGVKSFTLRNGIDGTDGLNGTNGSDGIDGFSPIISVQKYGLQSTISITDKNGTKAVVLNDGMNGSDGTDGFSPILSVSKEGKQATINITDKDGTKTVVLHDGLDGQNGEDGYTPVKGVDYFDGQPGRDGVDGQPGRDGRDGTDATVTADSIASALGYTPADAEEVGELKDDITSVNLRDAGLSKRTYSTISRGTRKPRLTFVDDDGYYLFDEKCRPILLSGYPVTSAIDPINWVGTDEFMDWNTIHELKNLGAEFVMHCKWNWGEELVGEERERYFNEARQVFKEHGLTGWDIGIYPHGLNYADTRAFMHRHLRACAMTIAGADGKYYSTSPIASYRLPRMGITTETTPARYRTYDEIKEQIDNAIRDNGWLIIYGHAYSTGWTSEITQQIIRLMDYATENGMVVSTMADALDEYANLVETGDFIGLGQQSRHYVIGHDGMVSQFPNTFDNDVVKAMANASGISDENKNAIKNNIGISNGTMSLIEDYTLPSNMNRVDRSASPDGTPYNFDAVRVVMNLGLTTTVDSDMYLSVNNTHKMNIPKLMLGTRSDGKKPRVIIDIENYHGFLKVSVSSSVEGEDCGQTLSIGYNQSTIPFSGKITSLGFVGMQANIHINSNIKIYGC